MTGTYSSSPAGLTLNTSTGAITPGTSTPGDYDVVYTFTNSTCGTIQFTTKVSIVVSQQRVPLIILINLIARQAELNLLHLPEQTIIPEEPIVQLLD